MGRLTLQTGIGDILDHCRATSAARRVVKVDATVKVWASAASNAAAESRHVDHVLNRRSACDLLFPPNGGCIVYGTVTTGNLF